MQKLHILTKTLGEQYLYLDSDYEDVPDEPFKDSGSEYSPSEQSINEDN